MVNNKRGRVEGVLEEGGLIMGCEVDDKELGVRPHAWRVRVRTAGQVEPGLDDYFGGLKVAPGPEGSSVITGELPDLPAVYGLIIRFRDLALAVVFLQVKKVYLQGGPDRTGERVQDKNFKEARKNEL